MIVGRINVGHANVTYRWRRQQLVRLDRMKADWTPAATMPSRILEMPTWLLGRAYVHSHRLLFDGFAAAGSHGYHYRLLATLLEAGPASQAVLGRLTTSTAAMSLRHSTTSPTAGSSNDLPMTTIAAATSSRSHRPASTTSENWTTWLRAFRRRCSRRCPPLSASSSSGCSGGCWATPDRHAPLCSTAAPLNRP